MSLTKERINELLEYKDGKLYWKKALSPRVAIGEEAGCLDKIKGQYKIQIDGVVYLLHRAVFLMHHGFLQSYILHKDYDVTNNRIENLQASWEKRSKRKA